MWLPGHTTFYGAGDASTTRVHVVADQDEWGDILGQHKHTKVLRRRHNARHDASPLRTRRFCNGMPSLYCMGSRMRSWVTRRGRRSNGRHSCHPLSCSPASSPSSTIPPPYQLMLFKPELRVLTRTPPPRLPDAQPNDVRGCAPRAPITAPPLRSTRTPTPSNKQGCHPSSLLYRLSTVEFPLPFASRACRHRGRSGSSGGGEGHGKGPGDARVSSPGSP
jgi:hypothetical protein